MHFSYVEKADLAAMDVFKRLKAKYPALSAYLVYGSHLGQAMFGSAAKEILATFPAMILDGEPKKKGLRLLREREQCEKEKKDFREIDTKLNALGSVLEVDENVRVEIQFDELKYDLVWKLQQDDLVDRTLTPQTRASIRIVLGTLGRFASV